MRVSDYMTPNPATIHTQDSLRTAIDLMIQVGRRLPVIDNSGKLVGIVTDRDLRLAMNSPLVPHEPEDDQELLARTRVEEIMTYPVITTTPEVWLDQAAAIMLENNVSGLPVLDRRKKLVGIISVSDMLRALIHTYEDEVLNE